MSKAKKRTPKEKAERFSWSGDQVEIIKAVPLKESK